MTLSVDSHQQDDDYMAFHIVPHVVPSLCWLRNYGYMLTPPIAIGLPKLLRNPICTPSINPPSPYLPSRYGHPFVGDMQCSISTLFPKLPTNSSRTHSWRVGGSLLLTMLTGTPCSLTISLSYTITIVASILVLFTRIMCALFVRWFTTTQMLSLSFLLRGSPSTESIDIFFYFHCRTSNAINNPHSFFCSALTLWHIEHFATYLTTSPFILGQWNTIYISRYILSPPVWIVILEW